MAASLHWRTSRTSFHTVALSLMLRARLGARRAVRALSVACAVASIAAFSLACTCRSVRTVLASCPGTASGFLASLCSRTHIACLAVSLLLYVFLHISACLCPRLILLTAVFMSCAKAIIATNATAVSANNDFFIIITICFNVCLFCSHYPCGLMPAVIMLCRQTVSARCKYNMKWTCRQILQHFLTSHIYQHNVCHSTFLTFRPYFFLNSMEAS